MNLFNRNLTILLFLSAALFSSSANTESTYPEEKEEWVVYSTDVGWLRIGTFDEYKALWQKKDEIWGGKSTDTLKKTLLLQGFSSWNEAAEVLCTKLTKVQMHINPPLRGAPVRYMSAVLDTTEYYLRLTKGFSAGDVEIMSKGGNFKGMEYDWQAEWDSLRANNITPRYVFPRKQWLIHATQRSTRQGPQELDTWMCFSSQPDENGNFTVPLANGTTQGYRCDKYEGPFLDNYTMAEVMKRHDVKSVDLWPPVTSIIGRDVQPRVDATKIPDQPKDYGDDTSPLQPFLPDTTLQDWVIYEVEGGWLHVGTRYEFKSPLFKKDVIWGGNSAELAEKKLLAPQKNEEKFYSFDQALKALSEKLTDVTASNHPLTNPKETIDCKFDGKDYRLRIDRGGNTLVHNYKNYNYWGIWNRLAEYGITPLRKFGASKLVHVTGYYTYSGPQKADRWQLVPAGAVNADGKSMRLADGLGGTMGYNIDFASPELKSNYDLSPVLRNIIGGDEELKSKLGSVGTRSLYYGIRPDEVPDNPKNYGSKAKTSEIQIKEVIPDSAFVGDSVGVMLISNGIDYGCEVDFGENINVYNLVYGGASSQDGWDIWYCTLKIKDIAEAGMKTLATANVDGGAFSLNDAFEVAEKGIELCPFIKLIVPSSTDYPSIAGNCSRHKGEQEKAIQKMKQIARKPTGTGDPNKTNEKKRKVWEELQDARIDVQVAEEAYWENVGQLLGDLTEEQIRTITRSLQNRSNCLLEKSQDRLDILRNTTFSFFEDSPYHDREKEYRDTYKALDHTLKLWRSFAVMLQERREYEMQMARRLKTLGEKTDLPAIQQKLFQAHIMKGEISIIREQMMVEYGYQMKDSHGASLREAVQKREHIKISEQRGTAFWQWCFIGTRYFVGVNQTMFSGAFGLLQDSWNMLFGDYYELESMSVQIRDQIKKSREDFELKQIKLRELRGMSSEEMIALGDVIREEGVNNLDEDLLLLENNRVWVEETDGGLLRFRACYDDTYEQLRESEYRIMLRRGELSLRDMKETLNITMGANAESGEFNKLKMMFEPMKIVRNYFAEQMHDEFSSRVEFLAERETELNMARQLMPQFKKIDFDLRRIKWYPKLMGNHYALQAKNPNYLRWSIQMLALESKRREDIIELQLDNTSTQLQRHDLKRKRFENRRVTMLVMGSDWARWCKMDGIERLMMWDWQGALMSFNQAAKTNPEVVSPEAVENLKKALDWQISTEMGLESFEFLGNQGFYSVIFGFAGQAIGKGLHKAGINWWGLGSLDDVAMAAQEAQGFWGRSMKYWAGFADFTFGQINPFWNIATAQGTLREMRTKYLQSLEEIVEEVVSPEISVMLGYFGMDKEYADFLAEALVESYGGARNTNQSLALQDALSLQSNKSKWEQLTVLHRLFTERAQHRQDLVNDVKIIESMMKAERMKADFQLELARKALTDWDFNRLRPTLQDLEDAKAELNNQIEPANEIRLQNALNDLKQQMEQASTLDARIELIMTFFKDISFESQRKLFEKNVQHELCILSDNYRRELLDIMRHLFLEKFAGKYSEYFVGFTIYGSAAHPEWAAYKRLWSDLDITALLKETAPQEIREQFKKEFDAFFAEKAGIPPEALDIHMFADSKPVFRARIPTSMTSEGSALARALTGNPELAQRIYEESNENLKLLWQNMVDPERYLLPGNLVMFNFLVKMVGIMQTGELVKEGDHYQLVSNNSGFSQVYGNVQFDSWMGLDIVLDHLIHISHARENNEYDMYAYSKDLAKYSIRVLLARIIQTPVGLNRINDASPSEVEAAGGLEAFIVKVARELTELHGTQLLGLQRDQFRLMQEWIDRKEAKPFGEIFRERAGATTPLSENDPSLSRHIANHINETEAFLMESIRFTVASQGNYMLELLNSAETEQDMGKKRALEARFRQIVCSQAALWKRLRPQERKLVQLMAPANSRFWRIIEMYNDLEIRANDQNKVPNVAEIQAWWPVHVADDERKPQVPRYPGIDHVFATAVRAD